MSASGPSRLTKRNAARRSVLVAALLSPITPGLGHLYAGLPKRALAAVALVLAGHAVILAASLLPPETPAIGYLHLSLLGLGLLVLLAIAVDAAIGARRAGATTLRRFNNPLVYLVVFVAWIAEYQVFGRIEAAISTSTTYPVAAGSMEPTLVREDLVFGHKGYYAAHMPARGEVVAMRNPGDKDETYLLRVVGLPGDRVQIVDGVLRLNGEAVSRRAIDDAETGDGGRRAFSIVAETLPGGATYRISEQFAAAGFADNTPEQEVPPGSVFLLGDNRDNATDSRFFGPVKIDDLESRLTFIFWSRDDSRIGMAIQPGGNQPPRAPTP